MNGTSSRPVEAKIARLVREIADIDRFFYGMKEDDDRSLYAGMLERKRDEWFVLRSCSFIPQLRIC
jgi:hypothetical protein